MSEVEEEERPSYPQERVIADDEPGNYLEGSTWYTAEVKTDKNLPDDVLAMVKLNFNLLSAFFANRSMLLNLTNI